jgi:hypothetical protein
MTHLLPGSSSSLMMFLVVHHSICWVQVLPHFSVTYFELCYKLTSHNFFKHFVCYGRTLVTRSSLCDFRWYSFVWIYISMGGHIIPEGEKVNKALMFTFARCLSSSYAFLFPLHAKTFQSLEKIGNFIYHHWKFLLGPEECPAIFPILRHLQPSESYNWKRKNMSCWEALAT